MSKTTSIMLVGVGGQGTLLASRILGHVCLAAGYDVKVSEVHGMSQRGGSVVTYVRYGSEVASPVVEKGEADVILAFEQLEGARWLPYLKEGGKMVLSTQRLDPMPVITGVAQYPENIPEKLSELAEVKAADALSVAESLGNPKASNVVLIGLLSNYMDFPEASWLEAVKACVPERFITLNLEAFSKGRGLALV